MKPEYKKLANKIIKFMKILEPEGHNEKYYKDMFETMTDKDFEKMMKFWEEEKEVLHVYTPNMKTHIKFDNILKAAESIGYDIYQKLLIEDPDTGLSYYTDDTYMVIDTLIRRLQQTMDEKLSVPRSDVKIDALTGQVTGEDRAAGITNPEMQAINASGGSKTIEELAVARGGNIPAYGAFKQKLEELGEANVEDVLTADSISRSVVILDVYLTAMGYRTNLTERIPKE